MSDVDEVKSRLNIVDIINASVPLKKAGRNFKGLCPFHNEKTPSFMVSPDRQTFHCFGCGKGGSVIDFVMEYEHTDFLEALETLAEKAGVKLERRNIDTPESKIRNQLYEVNHLASEYYHYILTNHTLGEKARQYLKNRGVSEKTIKTFMLGYSPNGWESLKKYLNMKGYDNTVLSTAGLTVPSQRGGYDRFRGRVMFTLKDHRGNVAGFSGRLLDSDTKDLPAGRQEAKYINTSETPIYNKSQMLFGLDIVKNNILKSGEAIIMEGEFDVITSYQAGISNAVAIKGSALTEGHVRLMRRFTEKLLFALDSDAAGDAASRRGFEIAEKAGMEIKVVLMPSGKDPDEAIREDATEFKKAIKKAVPIYDFYLKSAVSRFDVDTASGKKKITEEIFPILSGIDNPVVRAHYIRKTAESLEVPEQAVAEGVRKAVHRLSVLSSEKITASADQKNTKDRLEMYILALILQGNQQDFIEDLTEKSLVDEFKNPGIKRIIRELIGYLSKENVFLIKDFADSLAPELLSIYDEAVLWDLSDFADNQEQHLKEWMKIIREFRKQVLKEKIRQETIMLKSKQQDEKSEEADKINQTLTGLTRDLRALEKI